MSEQNGQRQRIEDNDGQGRATSPTQRVEQATVHQFMVTNPELSYEITAEQQQEQQNPTGDFNNPYIVDFTNKTTYRKSIDSLRAFLGRKLELSGNGWNGINIDNINNSLYQVAAEPNDNSLAFIQIRTAENEENEDFRIILRRKNLYIIGYVVTDGTQENPSHTAYIMKLEENVILPVGFTTKNLSYSGKYNNDGKVEGLGGTTGNFPKSLEQFECNNGIATLRHSSNGEGSKAVLLNFVRFVSEAIRFRYLQLFFCEINASIFFKESSGDDLLSQNSKNALETIRTRFLPDDISQDINTLRYSIKDINDNTPDKHVLATKWDDVSKSLWVNNRDDPFRKYYLHVQGSKGDRLLTPKNMMINGNSVVSAMSIIGMIKRRESLS